MKSSSLIALLITLACASRLPAREPGGPEQASQPPSSQPPSSQKPGSQKPDGKLDFAHDVVPILKKHCVACHGGKESKGGFSVNTRQLILDAEAAEPGRARDSRLIELVNSADPDQQMPPRDKPRLTAAEVDRLRTWIDQGLAWEDGFTFAERRYEPPLRPRRPELPAAAAGESHPLDRILGDYLRRNGLPAPRPVGDAEFARRIHLDLVGLLPEPERLQAFLDDPASDKRTRLVRELLDDRFAYAEHWLTFWNDLLRNDYSGTGFITGGRKQISAWLYQALLENKPYDQFVRELISPTEASDGFIRGIRWRGNVSASQRQEIQFAQNVGQAFLGINLKCASCHDSFIDRWTLEETYGLAQVYATESLELHRCDKPTGKQARPAWLFPELGNIDPQAAQPERLRQLAELLTHPENGRFSRTIVNRLWQRLLGRGLVHPVDAMHTEPWNADLLDYLAVHLVDHRYDLKQTLELICTSQAYQGATPSRQDESQGQAYMFRGPVARRMTAEQFMDAVWQVTGAAPARFDAPIQRVFVEPEPAAGQKLAPQPLAARWIWSESAAEGKTPAAGETITFRRAFELARLPSRAFLVITCDNEYTVYLNGRRAAADTAWETVEVLDLLPLLKLGANELLVVARNAGSGPNPAGLICEARMLDSGTASQSGPPEQDPPEQGPPESLVQQLATGGDWQWTRQKPNQRGQFARSPDDWKPAVVLPTPTVWDAQVGGQLTASLRSATASPTRMVRASLLKNNAFLTALGRPTRDQIVTSRPTELTTLEAIDLANGQILADAIASGARQMLARHAGSTGELVDQLFHFALSRGPTPEEQVLARQLLGPQPAAEDVEDLMWSVFMLPEFQLIR